MAKCRPIGYVLGMQNKYANGLQARATLKDIAKIVGVSTTAISLALNDKGHLTEELRKKIKETAAQLAYSPNPAARKLRGVRGNSVGVVINYLNNPFFRDFLLGFENVMDKAGIAYSVSQTHDQLEKEQFLVRKMADQGYDGLIVLNCSGEYAHLQAVCDLFSIPVVLISHNLGDRFAAIQADNLNGGRIATEHLLSLDERPIYHLAGPQKKSGIIDRKTGFMQAMAAARPGIDPESLCIEVEGLTAEAGYKGVKALHARQKPPFGLFVTNDEVALGVLTYCRQKGFHLPRDVAIVGFSDIDLLETLDIPLTSVRIPQYRMGQMAGTTLLDLIAHPENRLCPPILTLPVSLVVRASTVGAESRSGSAFGLWHG